MTAHRILYDKCHQVADIIEEVRMPRYKLLKISSFVIA